MSLSTIRAKIKTILEGVSGVGKVYNYERYAANWKAFLDLYKFGSKIDGWSMQMMRAPEEAQASKTNYRTYSFILRHMYSLDDSAASQITFEDFNETVCDAFRDKPDLDGLCIECAPPDILISEPRMFSDVLAHYAEIELSVTAELQFT